MTTGPVQDPVFSRILEQLNRMETGQAVIEEALLGSARPGSAPGLIRRMDECERDRSDLRRLIGDLAVAVRTLEANPGKTALAWWEKLGLGILSMILSAIGGLVVYTSSKGGH